MLSEGKVTTKHTPAKKTLVAKLPVRRLTCTIDTATVVRVTDDGEHFFICSVESDVLGVNGQDRTKWLTMLV